jgi:predicted nucleic acid-binding protein
VGVRLGATSLEVRAGGAVIARHERSVAKGGESLVLDHYLEVLVRKPGALPGATALAQARAAGAFPPTHDAFWTACRRKHGDAAGTRALIEVLLAHRHLPADALIAAMRQAVDAGVTEAAVVLVEARRLADRQPAARVIPIGTLARFDRPTPALAGYGALLDAQATAQGQPAEHASGSAEHAGHRPHPEVVEVDAGIQAEGVGA